MKKMFIVAAVIAGFAFTASAGLDVYDSVTVHTLGKPLVVAAAAVQTNAAVDVATAKGIGNVIVFIGSAITNGAAYTNTVTLEHSASASTGYYTVTNGTGTALTWSTSEYLGTGVTHSVKLEAEMLKRYVRLKSSPVNDGGTFGGVLLFSK